MREQSSILQSRCVCAVDAVRLGLSGFRKLAHLHGPKPCHGSFDGLHLFEIKYTPTKGHVGTTGARGSAGPAHTMHSRNIFAKNVPVCGGRCSGYERSLMYP